MAGGQNRRDLVVDVRGGQRSPVGAPHLEQQGEQIVGRRRPSAARDKPRHRAVEAAQHQPCPPLAPRRRPFGHLKNVGETDAPEGFAIAREVRAHACRGRPQILREHGARNDGEGEVGHFGAGIDGRRRCRPRPALAQFRRRLGHRGHVGRDALAAEGGGEEVTGMLPTRALGGDQAVAQHRAQLTAHGDRLDVVGGVAEEDVLNRLRVVDEEHPDKGVGAIDEGILVGRARPYGEDVVAHDPARLLEGRPRGRRHRRRRLLARYAGGIHGNTPPLPLAAVIPARTRALKPRQRGGGRRRAGFRPRPRRC